MTHAQVGLRQRFPTTAERTAAQQREAASAKLRRTQAEERRDRVRLAVRHAWLDGLLARRSHRHGRRSAGAVRGSGGHRALAVRGRQQEPARRAARRVRRQPAGCASRRADAAGRAGASRAVALDRRRGRAAHGGRCAGLARRRPAADVAIAFGDASRARGQHGAGGRGEGGNRPRGVAACARCGRWTWATATATAAIRTGCRVRTWQAPPQLSPYRCSRALGTAAAWTRRKRAIEPRLRPRTTCSASLAADLRGEHQRWLDLGRRIAVYDEAILANAGAVADSALAAYRSEAGDLGHRGAQPDRPARHPAGAAAAGRGAPSRPGRDRLPDRCAGARGHEAQLARGNWLRRRAAGRVRGRHRRRPVAGRSAGVEAGGAQDSVLGGADGSQLPPRRPRQVADGHGSGAGVRGRRARRRERRGAHRSVRGAESGRTHRESRAWHPAAAHRGGRLRGVRRRRRSPHPHPRGRLDRVAARTGRRGIRCSAAKRCSRSTRRRWSTRSTSSSPPGIAAATPCAAPRGNASPRSAWKSGKSPRSTAAKRRAAPFAPSPRRTAW